MTDGNDRGGTPSDSLRDKFGPQEPNPIDELYSVGNGPIPTSLLQALLRKDAPDDDFDGEGGLFAARRPKSPLDDGGAGGFDPSSGEGGASSSSDSFLQDGDESSAHRASLAREDTFPSYSNLLAVTEEDSLLTSFSPNSSVTYSQVQGNMTITTQWQTTADSANDAIGADPNDDRLVVLDSQYEYLGATYIIRGDEILVAFSSNIPDAGLEVGDNIADDRRVGHGVAFLNSQTDQAIGTENPELLAIRFGAHHNDTELESRRPIGVFSDVQPESVTASNAPRGGLTLGQYEEFVTEDYGESEYASISNYLGSPAQPTYNEISDGTPVANSGFRYLTTDELEEASEEFGNAGIHGRHTFGFAISKDLLPQDESVLSLWAECGNDAIALDITNFGNPSVSFTKRVNGLDANTPEEAAVIAEDDNQQVVYSFELTNDGDVDLNGDSIEVVDPGLELMLLPFSDEGGDGILSVGETWQYATATQESVSLPRFVDFDTDAAGNPIAAGDFFENQYAPWGLTISAERTPSPDGSAPDPCRDDDPLTSSPNPDRENMAMAFNSLEPSGCDPDLFTDNQGMVLIVSEDGDQTDPDDNQWGGTFTLNWDSPVALDSLGILDLSENLELKAYAGDTLIEEFNVGGEGPKEQQRVDFTGLAPIDRLTAFSVDSFAFTDLSWTAFVENTATVTVTEDLFTITESDSAYYISGVEAPQPNRNLELFGQPTAGADCLCSPDVIVSSSTAIATL